jgi:sarcosine oxidase delta subunit
MQARAVIITVNTSSHNAGCDRGTVATRTTVTHSMCETFSETNYKIH